MPGIPLTHRTWADRIQVTPVLISDMRLAARTLRFTALHAALPPSQVKEYRQAAKRFEWRLRQLAARKVIDAEP